MKLLKKISAVSLIILTAALIASCNSSPNAGRTIITEARADLRDKSSFNGTLDFIINNGNLSRDQNATIDITLESDEDPGYMLTLELYSDGTQHMISYEENNEDKYIPISDNKFTITAEYTVGTEINEDEDTKKTFSISVNSIGLTEKSDFYKNVSEISVTVKRVSNERGFDTITISSTGTDWQISEN